MEAEPFPRYRALVHGVVAKRLVHRTAYLEQKELHWAQLPARYLPREEMVELRGDVEDMKAALQSGDLRALQRVSYGDMGYNITDLAQCEALLEYFDTRLPTETWRRERGPNLFGHLTNPARIAEQFGLEAPPGHSRAEAEAEVARRDAPVPCRHCGHMTDPRGDWCRRTDVRSKYWQMEHTEAKTEEAQPARITPQLVKEAQCRDLVAQVVAELQARVTTKSVTQALVESLGRACYFQLLTRMPAGMTPDDMDSASINNPLLAMVDPEAYQWELGYHATTTRCLYLVLSTPLERKQRVQGTNHYEKFFSGEYGSPFESKYNALHGDRK